MRRYVDMRGHLKNLEDRGLLKRVTRRMNKDTEIHPLVRWQYRGGLKDSERMGFLFENVVDGKGKKYPYSVAIGVMAGSIPIYAVGLQCETKDVLQRWQYAVEHPVPPMVVEKGSAQEVVMTGAELKKEGLGRLPIPISTPGFDNAPYTTCSNWVTKDPETGIQNIGNYRGHVKAADRIGVFPSALGQDIYLHWQKCKAKKIPLEAALIIGPPPVVSYAAVEKVPYGVDEMAIAGGLAGQPIEVIKCKTVDLLVPADTELVIEGKISTEYLEPEGPFGESHGHMHPRQMNPFMDITAITHRKDMIYVGWISQVTPSESSIIKKMAYEPSYLRFLKKECRIKSVTRVSLHEPLTNLRKLVIIQMKDPSESEIWRALRGAASRHQGVGKIVIAVDEDIDPENMDAVWWAIAYRSKPHLDMEILRNTEKGHAPPFFYSPKGHDVVSYSEKADDSALLINAMLKEPFPPVSLPKKEYMENALKIWQELDLPEIRPQSPWFGYSLGQWDEELEEEAELALKGEHYVTGEKLKGRRVKV
ncbi:MAG: UbiD family decarboxylase [Thermodesulfobacteriota bacterium]